ncbi:MAG: DUF2141 domain-containing protein [Pseudomonadota bacterium]|nr:DUF2141 domain-containing protein [Pseudomonadota bacterium]
MTLPWLVLLLGAAPPPDPVSVDIEVVGLRSTAGNIQACVWHGPEHFLAAKACAKYGRVVVAPAGPTVSLKLDLQPGEYAVSLFHDANANGKLDKNLLGMPTEGFGFSRNPVIAFSQPSYAATRFEAAAATTETIRMKYFL